MQKIDRSFQIPQSKGIPDHRPNEGTDPEIWLCTGNATLYLWSRENEAWEASGQIPPVETFSLGFLIYAAILNQTGVNAPTATIVRNDLSGPIVWTRVTDGIYNGTLVGAFPENKTICLTSGNNTWMNVKRTTDDLVRIMGQNDDELSTTSIVVLVFE